MWCARRFAESSDLQMMLRWLGIFRCGWLALMMVAWAGQAVAIETNWRTILIMPGKVSNAHAKIESDCDKCHYSLNKGKQDALCMDCHKEVGADVKAKGGYHGRIMADGKASCVVCHTEHEGRDHSIIAWDIETFNHNMTDFALKGRHTTLACERCHKENKLHREASVQCFACHEKDDRHKGALGKDCGKCHVEDGWGKQKFNHDDTGYKLEGKHKEAPCATCHPGERYKDTPDKCVNCHQLNDVHRGQMANDCGRCHQPEAWSKVHFDHSRDTDYPLTHKHLQIKCDACHGVKTFKELDGSVCYDCHRKDDEHAGRNGTECEKCHTTKGWKQLSFDHNVDTKFPIRGKHKELNCEACHRGDLHAPLSSQCVDCHLSDDIHNGGQGDKCEKCHSETGWRAKVMFDHGLTRFPLVGMHEVVPCEDCHVSTEFRGTPVDCIACHKTDDYHAGTLGEDCLFCHNPNGWRLWLFDHDKQTDFKLDGAHKDLVCEGCHTKRVKKAADIRIRPGCYECHQGDDIHDREFGQDCSQCHLSTSFHDLGEFFRLNPKVKQISK
jgi:hypothetical protein